MRWEIEIIFNFLFKFSSRANNYQLKKGTTITQKIPCLSVTAVVHLILAKIRSQLDPIWIRRMARIPLTHSATATMVLLIWSWPILSCLRLWNLLALLVRLLTMPMSSRLYGAKRISEILQIISVIRTSGLLNHTITSGIYKISKKNIAEIFNHMIQKIYWQRY